MHRKSLLLILFVPLILQCFPVTVCAQEMISKGTLISDSVPFGQTAEYYLSENLSRNSVVILSVERMSGEGTFVLQKGVSIIGDYSVHSYVTSTSQLTLGFRPFFLPENGTGYVFNVSSDSGEDFRFSFFYDVADVLAVNNTKNIPFEAGAVGYYADLSRGDRLSLSLNFSESTEFDLLVMPSLSALSTGYDSSSVIGTFFTPAPKYTEFVTDHGDRYLVFVIATRGTGNFTLSTLHTGNPLEGLVGNVRDRVDYLNNLVDNLILICVASFFVALLSLYLYFRLRKTLQKNLGVSGTPPPPPV